MARRNILIDFIIHDDLSVQVYFKELSIEERTALTYYTLRQNLVGCLCNIVSCNRSTGHLHGNANNNTLHYYRVYDCLSYRSPSLYSDAHLRLWSRHVYAKTRAVGARNSRSNYTRTRLQTLIHSHL